MSKSSRKSDKKDRDFELEGLSIKVSKKEDEELQKDGMDEKLLYEIINIVIFLIACLLLVSQVSTDTGIIGLWSKELLGFLFGKSSIIVPIFLIFTTGKAFITKTQTKKINYFYLIIILIIIVSFFHVTTVDPSIIKEQKYSSMVKVGLESGNGGVVGSVIGSFLVSFLGKTGSILFSIAMFILMFILSTGESFIEKLVYFLVRVNGKIKEEVFNILPDGQGSTGKHDNDYVDENTETILAKLQNTSIFKSITNYINDYDDIYITDEEDHVDYVKINDEDIQSKSKESVAKFVDIDEDNDENIEAQLKRSNLVYNPQEISKNIINMNDYNKTEEDLYTEIVDITVPKSKRRYKDNYKFPSINLLNKNPAVFSRNNKLQAEETKQKLQNIFKEFNVNAKVTGYFRGPTVTRYEVAPGEGVKVSRISGLSDEIALNLASQGIRIEAPIPGKPAVGIEIPNQEPQPVYLREIIGSKEFNASKSKLTFSVGKDIEGNVIISDIKEMPHLLIAGATGSGKSVCINSLIISIIYKAKPEEVKLLMIDPKVVELSVYNGIPHLMIPVVTDPKKAAGALSWAVREMTDRYNLFSKAGVRGLEGYNKYLFEEDMEELPLPQIVVIIDELSDLMQTSSSEVEENIKRLSQMARAAGIYLIIATQRPSVDVITGVIKANIPSRLAFSVSSGTDSRTILDMVGAEQLLGKGDMLFYPKGISKPIRVQGAYISDKEVEHVVSFLKENNNIEYNEDMIDEITSTKTIQESKHEIDKIFNETMRFVIEKKRASASLLQRQFRIGYNRASRIIDALEEMGVIGEERGSKPRKVLMDMEGYEEYLKNKET